MAKRVAIVLFSIGWVAPAWLGLGLFMTFLNSEVSPALHGMHPVNSFPFIAFSGRCWTVALVWFAGVAAFWSWKLGPLILSRQQSNQPPT